MKIPWKLKELYLNMLPHYLIIGKYSGDPIGCTCGKGDHENVLAEEPGSTFKRVRRQDCPICNGD